MAPQSINTIDKVKAEADKSYSIQSQQESIFTIDEKYVKIILQPFAYYNELPSKNIRRKIANIFNYWYKCSEEDMDRANKGMHELHNASLIIDDIEDGSELRRGVPAAHIKYGVPLALNAANFKYFEAIQAMLVEENKDCSPEDKIKGVLEFVRGMMVMHIGQGMEIFWRDENLKAAPENIFQHIPTEKEYYDVIVKKTSEQFAMLAAGLKERSKTIFKDQPSLDTSELAKAMGYHFQIRDDLLNLVSNTYEAGKGFCEDITEGKFSFPIIYTLNRFKEQNNEAGLEKACRLIEILRMRTMERELKQEALDIISGSGAIEYCKNILDQYHDKIARQVLRLGGNPKFVECMDIFSPIL